MSRTRRLLAVALLLATAPAANRLGRAYADAPAAPPVPTAPAALPTRTVVGEIASVDAAHGSLVVVETAKTKKKAGQPEPKRERLTIRLDASTRVLRGKSPASPKDLYAADHVVIRYVVAADGLRALSVRAAEPVTQAAKTPDAAAPGDPSPEASR